MKTQNKYFKEVRDNKLTIITKQGEVIFETKRIKQDVCDNDVNFKVIIKGVEYFFKVDECFFTIPQFLRTYKTPLIQILNSFSEIELKEFNRLVQQQWKNNIYTSKRHYDKYIECLKIVRSYKKAA